MIASPNTHSLNVQTKAYRQSYSRKSMPATQIMYLSPSLFPFLSIEVVLCIFAKANSLAFAPKYLSVNVCSWQGAASVHYCMWWDKTRYRIHDSKPHKDKESSTESQNWLTAGLGLVGCWIDDWIGLSLKILKVFQE